MKVFSLMYHDVVEPGAWDSSGFPGTGAAVYKLERAEFGRHLDAIAATGASVVRATEPLVDGSAMLTFDDGGVGAISLAAEIIEKHGWVGHFFVTTDRIGTAGFLSREQIQEMRRRGHVIGSHSCSHPTRMANCTREELQREWSESVRVLEDILGEPVPVASVPGGYYSRVVGATAAEAGIRVLFNSEPTAAVSRTGECLLLGRYWIQRGMPAGLSGAFAAGRLGPRWKQSALFQIKKVAKAAGGKTYLSVRERLLKG
ncbi:MAG: polysaccharide deacetylase family protein [Bryobacteraceae bacterium]